jgi:spermidine/putrescine transport system permease protein
MLLKPRVSHIAIEAVHIGWQALLYGIPLAFLTVISFWTMKNYRLAPAFTFGAYQELLIRPQYAEAVLNSVRLALISSFLAVMFALPIAYTLVFRVNPITRRYILLALLLPFFSSYVMRMFAWQIWLNNRGILVAAIDAVFGPQTGHALLFTEAAVLIGLLSVLIPIASIIIYLSLSTIDLRLIFAARNLGASRFQTFLRIELPFAFPGMLSSAIFCFLIAFGDYVCSSILGGNRVYYVSIAIQDRLKINEWPMAAALGTIMLMVSVAVLVLLFWLFSKLPSTVSGARPGE